MTCIYFDHNATTNIRPEAIAGYSQVFALGALNPSSIHRQGQKAKAILQDARSNILESLNADGYQVIFTASGTESNNLSLRGISNARLLIAQTEHSSVLKNANEALIPVNEDGLVRLDVLERLLQDNGSREKTIVSIMTANNETGVLQPIKEICDLCHKYNALMHTDACQAISKIHFSLQDARPDMVSISGHKFGAGNGAAALLFRKDTVELGAIMYGGGQEFRHRPGTQNIAAIAAMSKSISIAVKEVEEYQYHTKKLQDFLENSLSNLRGVYIYGSNAKRLSNTVNIVMPGVDAQTQVIFFDNMGFCVSAGSACSSGRTDLPYVQLSMNSNEKMAKESIRISFSLHNTKEEVEKFIQAWETLYNKAKS